MKPYGLIKRTLSGCRTRKVEGRPISVIPAPPKSRKAERRLLAKEYEELVGYDPFEDDPSVTEEEVARTIEEYKEEARRDA